MDTAPHPQSCLEWSSEHRNYGREPVGWGEPQQKSSGQGQQSGEQNISSRQVFPLPSAQSSICIKTLSSLLFCLIGKEHQPITTGTTTNQHIKAGVSSG